MENETNQKNMKEEKLPGTDSETEGHKSDECGHNAATQYAKFAYVEHVLFLSENGYGVREE